MKITKYSAKSLAVHKMSLKKQLRKAHKELAEEEKKYPKQSLYNNAILQQDSEEEDRFLNEPTKDHQNKPTKDNQNKPTKDNQTESNNLSDHSPSESLFSSNQKSNSYQKSTNRNPFQKAQAKYEQLRMEREERNIEFERQKKEHKEQLRQNKKNRNELKKKHFSKNSKGQPRLGDQVTSLLTKINRT